jgi:hypothetical protein
MRVGAPLHARVAVRRLLLWGYANEQLETRVRERTLELQESQAFDAVSLTSAVHVALQRARRSTGFVHGRLSVRN